MVFRRGARLVLIGVVKVIVVLDEDCVVVQGHALIGLLSYPPIHNHNVYKQPLTLPSLHPILLKF